MVTKWLLFDKTQPFGPVLRHLSWILCSIGKSIDKNLSKSLLSETDDGVESCTSEKSDASSVISLAFLVKPSGRALLGFNDLTILTISSVQNSEVDSFCSVANVIFARIELSLSTVVHFWLK